MSTVMSHGWYALAPWQWSEADRSLRRGLQRADGSVVPIVITETTPGTLTVSVRGYEQTALDLVRRVLRLDEDLSGFWSTCRKMGADHIADRKTGRLLRSPTVFEDVIKVMLTTNTSWPRTVAMCNRLVNRLGAGDEDRTFPGPEAIVQAGTELLRSELRLGYRSDFIVDVARRVIDGDIQLEQLMTCEQADTARRILLSIRGVGPYAAACILALIGHYTDLPVDSEFVRRLDPEGKLLRRDIRQMYTQWDKWRYLAYWFDLQPADEPTIPTLPV